MIHCSHFNKPCCPDKRYIEFSQSLQCKAEPSTHQLWRKHCNTILETMQKYKTMLDVSNPSFDCIVLTLKLFLKQPTISFKSQCLCFWLLCSKTVFRYICSTIRTTKACQKKMLTTMIIQEWTEQSKPINFLGSVKIWTSFEETQAGKW